MFHSCYCSPHWLFFTKAINMLALPHLPLHTHHSMHSNLHSFSFNFTVYPQLTQAYFCSKTILMKSSMYKKWGWSFKIRLPWTNTLLLIKLWSVCNKKSNLMLKIQAMLINEQKSCKWLAILMQAQSHQTEYSMIWEHCIWIDVWPFSIWKQDGMPTSWTSGHPILISNWLLGISICSAYSVMDEEMWCSVVMWGCVGCSGWLRMAQVVWLRFWSSWTGITHLGLTLLGLLLLGLGFGLDFFGLRLGQVLIMQTRSRW